MEQVIKPFSSAALPVYIYGLVNSNIDEIHFIFKKNKQQQAEKIIKKTYTKNSSSEVEFDKTNGYYIIKLTPEDTANFETSLVEYTVWLDIQPQKIEGSSVSWIYPTETIPITIYPSLYSNKILDKIYSVDGGE